jgi:hypothetical protein
VEPFLNPGNDFALFVHDVDVEQRFDLPLSIGLVAPFRNLFRRDMKRGCQRAVMLSLKTQTKCRAREYAPVQISLDHRYRYTFPHKLML